MSNRQVGFCCDYNEFFCDYHLAPNGGPDGWTSDVDQKFGAFFTFGVSTPEMRDQIDCALRLALYEGKTSFYLWSSKKAAIFAYQSYQACLKSSTSCWQHQEFSCLLSVCVSYCFIYSMNYQRSSFF